MDPAQLDNAIRAARSHLLGLRTADGHWTGELSSSALATATAAFALAVVARETGTTEFSPLIRGGLDWLARHQNADGGWGDTVACRSNASATVLAWATLDPADAGLAAAMPRDPAHAAAARTAEDWLARAAGSLQPRDLARTIDARYAGDRTFSAPILTMCALAGRLGAGRDAWRYVYPLPFELAVLPHALWRRLRLRVVSYALPALVAIGQARHHFRPPSIASPLRLVRRLARRRTLNLLTAIQPPSGGFLEAAPLTSFVAMSLAAAGHARHPAVEHAVGFLTATVRPDGSWAIDTNLATWVTTLAVAALAGRTPEAGLRPGEAGPDFLEALPPDAGQRIAGWLIAQHHRAEHPYTHAPPGGWAWTDLAGGVPDADDTAGALVALRHLAPVEPYQPLENVAQPPSAENNVNSAQPRAAVPHHGPPSSAGCYVESAAAGARWLMDLQNSDGGIPTFCRGWGRLPFDRSSPDLTAHAIAAWIAWLPDIPAALRMRAAAAVARAVAYLEHTQTPDGTWIPLWFGNEHAPREENPTYGTARVVAALATLAPVLAPAASDFAFHPDPVRAMIARGANWLLASRGVDGGWGGDRGTPPSIEETALAVDALARLLPPPPAAAGSVAQPPSAVQQVPAEAHARGRACHNPDKATLAPAGDLPVCQPLLGAAVDPAILRGAVLRGAEWLIERTRGGTVFEPAPIGFYFAKVWYSEQLYPVIFTVAALQRTRAMCYP